MNSPHNPHARPLSDLRVLKCSRKFYVRLDGVQRAAYFIDTDRGVLKLDGEHTYLWYRDPRLDPVAILIDD